LAVLPAGIGFINDVQQKAGVLPEGFYQYSFVILLLSASVLGSGWP